jgi:hypothetical protein
VSKPLFVDHNEREYERQQDADERRRYFRVVRDHMAGGVEAAENEAVTLAQYFADATDGASLCITYLNMPPHLRCFVDAVIGASGGSNEFVEISDEVLAKRLGRSIKSVQRYRDEFRAWNEHGAIIEIKDNWRHPETHESHAHAYRCHVTQLAVETVLDARLSPEWDRNRRKALEEAGQTVAEAAPCFPPRKLKKRRKASDGEVMRRNLQQAAQLVDQATRLRGMVRNPDFEEVWQLRQELAEKLKALDEAFGFEPADVHVKTNVRSMDNEAPAPISEPSEVSRRMDVETDSEGVETEVDTTHLDKVSTWNDSTESTTYENQEFSPSEFPPSAEDSRNRPDEPETVDDGAVEEVYYPPGISDEEANAIWERAFGGLKGGARDATAAT